jgi:hypothetical protein
MEQSDFCPFCVGPICLGRETHPTFDDLRRAGIRIGDEPKPLTYSSICREAADVLDVALHPRHPSSRERTALILHLRNLADKLQAVEAAWVNEEVGDRMEAALDALFTTPLNH